MMNERRDDRQRNKSAKTRGAAARRLRLLSFAAEEARIPVEGSADIMKARRTGSEFALRLGFSASEATLIAAIISEIARNIIQGARQGQIIFGSLENGLKRGIEVVARYQEDEVARSSRAVHDGSGGSQRRELAGVGKLVDEFNVVSEQGNGITVTVKKWRQPG